MSAKGRALTANDVQLERIGEKVIIPAGMSARELYIFAKRNYEKEEQEHEVMAELPCGSPLDGLVNFHRALADVRGYSSMVTTPPKSFFDSEHPPVMMDVFVGPNQTVQVGYGRLIIPGIEGYLETSMKIKPRPAFVISGVIKYKHKAEIERIIHRAREFLAEQSIYKGQAVKVSYKYEREGVQYDPFEHAPKFWDVRPGHDDVLIFADDIAVMMQEQLWSFIELSPAFRKNKIPLKRGVLLAGPYGTGKTLSAKETARRCLNNGWTFIHLDDVQDLTAALRLAAEYTPTVLFAEDVDQVVQGDRSLELNTILNALDGVDTKDKEIIVVLTTNRLESIHPSVLRPGRIDALIPMRAPDSEAAIRLVRHFGGSMVSEQDDLTSVGEVLDGKIPAVIREVVEMSKSSALTRIHREGGDLDDLNLVGGQVTAIDLVHAAKAKESHNELINRPVPEPKTPADRIAAAFIDTVIGGNIKGIQRVSQYMDEQYASHEGAANEAEAAARANGR